MPTADDRVQAITDTVNRYIALLAGGDVDDLVSLYADDATVEDPVGAEVVSGRDGLEGFWDGVRAMSPEIELQLTGAPRLAAGEAAFPMRAITTLGDAKLAVEMARRLLDHGIYVVGFAFPVVPKGQARIRVQLSAAHSETDIDRAVAAFTTVSRELAA